MTIRIGVIGCGGRMGRLLLRTVLEDLSCRLSGGVEQSRGPDLGQDLGRLAGLEPIGLKAIGDARMLVEESDAVIEFTTPEATVITAGPAAAAGRAHVIGTTGLSETQKAAIRRASERGADRTRREYEPRRHVALGVRRRGRAQPRCRLGHRNPRNASPPEGGCAPPERRWP